MNKLVSPFSRFVLLTVLSLFGFVYALAQPTTLKIATEEDIKCDLPLSPCKNSERLSAVESLFRDKGATDADVSIVDKKGTKNLVVIKKGSGAGIIVIGAHYDKVSDGCGVLDNWTGIVAIAHLYGTIREIETVKTIKFVAFDKEELGLIGSQAFTGTIAKEERAAYCSMVNLDSFGLAMPQVMENTSSPKLIDAARAFWTTMRLKLASASIVGADADSSSFLKAGIPAITFHGMNNDWPQFLHSRNDKLGNVNAQSVFLGYRLVLPFLVEIDKAECGAFGKS